MAHDEGNGIMTQYFLTVPHDTATEPTMESMQEFDPAELAAVMAAVDDFNTALKDAGALLFAGGLNPPSTAKTVDVSSGESRVLDEPFVEAESYVGGFWVIEASDESTAVEWATKASNALQCRIEVRALRRHPTHSHRVSRHPTRRSTRARVRRCRGGCCGSHAFRRTGAHRCLPSRR